MSTISCPQATRYCKSTAIGYSYNNILYHRTFLKVSADSIQSSMFITSKSIRLDDNILTTIYIHTWYTVLLIHYSTTTMIYRETTTKTGNLKMRYKMDAYDWTKIEKLLQPSTRIRKLQWNKYGRRQLHDQSGEKEWF